MKRITCGISRTVFLVGKYAIKVPCGRYGWKGWLKGLLANLKERELIKYGFPQFCPILWSDPLGLVVIMPRCRILTEEEAMDTMQYHDFFRSTFPVFNHWIPTENKADSFGYLGDKLVAVDYGN
jgi:hypothetical protein